MLKKLHKWPSVIIAFFVIQFAVSGIILNHRGIFSKVDVSRTLLPWNYRYKNWNLAAVRGSFHLQGDSSLLYGNVGAWLTVDDFNTFTDYNEGFSHGIDNHKIYSVLRFKRHLIAATHFGLYIRDLHNDKWEKINSIKNDDRIADLCIKNDTLLILSRHYLYRTTDLIRFEKIMLPSHEGYVKRAGLFNTLWELHSGELFGLTGQLVVDLFGLVVILMSVTGLLHYFLPGIIRRRKERNKLSGVLKKIKKKNLKWHNVAGYIFVFFLLINTTAGMFLRPPLLIAIANSYVGIIPGTHLDTPNPWHDKLRRILWDETLNKYIISTSDGFFLADKNLRTPLAPCTVQPPVSLMGCNIFEPVENGIFIVGSFSGIFKWDFNRGTVKDYFTNQPYTRQEGIGKPIGENMAAGYVNTNKKGIFWFDYNTGVKILNNSDSIYESGNPQEIIFPGMTSDISSASPMSLWNIALEFHTGRIFEHLIGSFYILYVPLAGLCILIVLISGFLLWWKVYR